MSSSSRSAQRALAAPLCAALLLIVGAPGASAQRLADGRIGLVAPVQPVRAVVPTPGTPAGLAELPGAPGGRRRSHRLPEELIIFMATGMAAGMVVGGVVGVVEAVQCKHCFPGTQPMLVALYSILGIPYGGAAGIATYFVVWPVRYVWRRL